ncbi:hypothetical protein [Yersinia sp. 2466 StPb PI]|uniref:hypothetical protein n=1 Tax=Yersinia sp. 2466 StPb PI TaxID=3061648 RepID=UPI00355AF63D
MDEDKILEQLNDDFQKKVETERNAAIEVTQNRLRQIAPATLADFFEIKGVSKTCLSCGDSKLSTGKSGTVVKSRDDNNALSYQETWWATYYFRSGSIGRHINDYYYEVICLNCGLISRHRASTIVHWFEERKREAAEWGDIEWE